MYILTSDLLMCRSFSDVLGLSKETLVAIITNIEDHEWQQIDNGSSG